MMEWPTQVMIIVAVFALVGGAYHALVWWHERKARIRREYMASVTRQAAAAIARSLGERDAQ